MAISNPKPVTEEAFEVLKTLDNWTVYEIPVSHWPKLKLSFRRDDWLAVYGSGCQLEPQEMHDQLVQVGLDILVDERNPKLDSRYGVEPVVNIYHMVFQRLNRKYGDFSALAYGPFNCGALQEHWPKNVEQAIQFYCDFDKVIGVDAE